MSEDHEMEESFEEMEFTRKKALHAVLSFALALVLIVVLVVVVVVMQMTKSKADKEERSQLVPAVAVLPVRTVDRALELVSQGVVESMRDVVISAEVGGRVVEVSPNLLQGAVVTEGEWLVRIEKADYHSALLLAKAGMEDANLQLDQEKARRDQALRDWKKLGRGEPSDLVLRKPHIASAEARLVSATEEVERAGRNIERTEITAPFSGTVREESVEFGAVLTPGSMVARIYSTDKLEVRLPLSLEDFGSLPRDEEGKVTGEVTLKGVIGMDEYRWSGRVVRMDGEIQRATLSATVIVEVEASETNPVYLRRPPVGLFVEAVIPGMVIAGVVEIPRWALRGKDRVLVVDGDSRMHEVQVTIRRSLPGTVLVSDGLKDGDLVIVTRMSGVVDNGKVEVVDGLVGEEDVQKEVEEVTAP